MGAILTALVAVCLASVAVATARTSHVRHVSRAADCPEPSAYSDPLNPLMLPTVPGSDLLNGALPYTFVDGPAHGAAAGAIAQLVGRDPKRYPDSYSWARFYADLQTGALHRKLARNPSLAHKVAMLEKIADEPEANRFSLYSAGGGPGAIYSQTHKIFCDNIQADPDSIPIITTYFLYQAGYCETTSQILAHRGTFERQVSEMTRAIGNRRAIMLLELDAVGASRCMVKLGSLGQWEANIHYEITKVAALPHVVAYIEGGYADGNPPGYTAQVLNAVGIGSIEGFFTNDTHNDWTINEVRWAEQVSRLTHGAHFVVNTANNGQGPLVPRHRVHNGNEVLCNAPGRGLGPRPTTSPGFPHADAFLWTAVPGNSSGHCNGGPAAGTFWPARGIGEASRANGRLGPGYPSKPY
jgi:endoglucanase